jgi:hypothetical protein
VGSAVALGDGSTEIVGSGVGSGVSAGVGSGVMSGSAVAGTSVMTGAGVAETAGLGRGVATIEGSAVWAAGTEVVGVATGAMVARDRKNWEVRDDLGCGEHERATQQGHRQDRHDQRTGRPHRPAKDLGAKVGEPRTLRLTAGSIVQGGEQDPLIEVRRRARDGQRAEKPEDARAAADLGVRPKPLT